LSLSFLDPTIAYTIDLKQDIKRKIQNLEKYSVDGRNYNAGFSEEGFLVVGEKVYNQDINKIIFAYLMGEEIAKNPSNKIRREANELENELERANISQARGLLKEFPEGIVSKIIELRVHPKLVVRGFRPYQELEYYKRAANFIDSIGEILEYGKVKEIYNNLSVSEPYIKPYIDLLRKVENSPNFEIDENILKDFKKVMYEDRNSYGMRRITERVQNQIKNTFEYKTYRSEIGKREEHWKSVQGFFSSEAYRRLKIIDLSNLKTQDF